MLKYGEDTGLPGTYRITLALSVAFLLHTLLMATFPFDLPEHNNNPVTVSVQLVQTGSTASTADSSAQSSPPVRATPFTLEDILASQSTRDMPTTTSPQARSTPEPAVPKAPATETTSKPRRQSRQEQQNEPAPQTRTSMPSVAGEQAPRQEDDQPEDYTMKSDKPTEELKYEAQLARKIGNHGLFSKDVALQLGIRRGIDIQLNSMEIELKLMGNGTLVNARITKSSGNRPLDELFYKAALGASPYPEPPPSTANRRRFRVELSIEDL